MKIDVKRLPREAGSVNTGIDQYWVDAGEWLSRISEADRKRLLDEARDVLAAGGQYLTFTDSSGMTLLLQVSRYVSQ